MTRTTAENAPTEVVASSGVVAAAELPGHLWLLWAGSAISRLGNVSATTAGPLLALQLTDSPIFAGLVAAAGTIPNLLLHLPAGVLVDRFDRWRIMVASQLVRLFTAGLLVWGLWNLDEPIVLLPIAAAIESTFATFYHMAETAALPRIVPNELLSKAMTKNEARNHAALLLGRPLGGLLYGLGRALPFIVDMVTCVLSLLTLASIRNGEFRPIRRSSAKKAKMADQVSESLWWLWRDVFLRRVLVVCTITNFLFQMVIILLVVLARHRGLPSALIGVLLAASGMGGILGALLAPRILQRIQLRKTAVVCTWTWCVLTTVMAVADHPVVLLLVWAGVGFVGAHMNVALTVYQATSVPETLRGRVASLNSFAARAPAALGALMGGFIISRLGTQQAAFAVAATMLALAISITVHRRIEKETDDQRIKKADMALKGDR
ncbi:MFS transporter [Actinomadura scrupuli]|uniref:MFS transporter n=1 Tax=Actinomadura scrupuli TaxID=559629 RepID=UPI003D97BE0D